MSLELFSSPSDPVKGNKCISVLKTFFSIGKSMAQVSLRWLLQKPIVSSVIIGATKTSQLDDNMGASNGWELTTEEVLSLVIIYCQYA